MTRDGWITRLRALAERLRGGGARAVITADEYDEIAKVLAEEPNPMAGSGVMLIAVERRRQMDEEGWGPEHDDEHVMGELAEAGAAYASVASAQARGASAHEFAGDFMVMEGDWPFEPDSWKPRDQIANLVRAGAFIAAEIDRLKRQEQK